MTEDLNKLREEFPAGTVGKLPKGGQLLDYVGHAAVTDRLLTVDPEWNWEPLATDDYGLPKYDNAGGLWIKLTVLGVTRLGYGDGPDPKQRISDALRNAAMRFGVALSLWTKDELESGHSEQHAEPEAPGDHRPQDHPFSEQRQPNPPSTKQVSFMNSLLHQTGLDVFDLYQLKVIDHEAVTVPDLNGLEVKKSIDYLIAVRDGKQPKPEKVAAGKPVANEEPDYEPDEMPF